MTSRLYNILSATALVWVPAIGTLVFALGNVWSWNQTENVIGGIMAFDTFLGALLKLTGRKLSTGGAAYVGNLLINTGDPAKDIFSLDITAPLNDIPDMKEIRLKVEPTEGFPKDSRA
jgi:hypothetical protein